LLATPRPLPLVSQRDARTAYPGVLTALTSVVEGTPQVHTYDVANSTFHKIVAPVTA